MRPCRVIHLVGFALGFTLGCLRLAAAGPADQAAQEELFETRIRPVLTEHCYACHNSAETAEGELALDHRRAVLRGGTTGPAIVPGQPDQSLLIRLIEHQVPGREMPDGDPQLSERVIADFRKWIEQGAWDPRDAPPTADELAEATSWETQFNKRLDWWSLQPIRDYEPSLPESNHWSPHPVDRFILAKLESHGLQPAPPASRRALIRRLSYALLGLPPDTADVERFLSDSRADAYERLVDRYLDSPHFGERWARHWMDWVRYAESHGSEGDPEIVNAWHYRDYLIRALNADVSCRQLVREHVAGDLIEDVRLNESLQINESQIGTAHWRMVFHGFAPTDALDEKVRFTDDQLNAFTKAFLGLTVSCARCHDHKFDAISQADYYALFGILASCRPSRFVIDTPEVLQYHRTELAKLKPTIRAAIGHHWRESIDGLVEKLTSLPGGESKDGGSAGDSLLGVWQTMQRAAGDREGFSAAWQELVERWQRQHTRRRNHWLRTYARRWQLNQPEDFERWYAYGAGLQQGPSGPGEFALAPEGEQIVTGIYPSGVYSHLLSNKQPARLTSPNISLDKKYDVWLHVVGGGGATSRYAVQNYPRNGTVYPVRDLPAVWEWQRYDLAYWQGDEIHLELTSGSDAPLLVKGNGRSWLGVREVVLVEKDTPTPPNNSLEHWDPLFQAAADQPPASLDELAHLVAGAAAAAVDAWLRNQISDEQAVFLTQLLAHGWLPNRLDEVPQVVPLVTRYRELETALKVPTRVPGLAETNGADHPLFERGNHRLPTTEIPRRFLSAVDDTPYETTSSGRLQLAADLVRPDNPLTRRVLVNRIWHHLWGRGIVATPDNLGRLGDMPTHPELLDYLATRFAEEEWSLKGLIRQIVTSRAWQQSSRPSTEAARRDPENQWLSHAHLRRLEAEAIRDAVLTVAGALDRTQFGPPADGGQPRRSIYLRVRRNTLDPFLRVFDFPEPYTATGRRSVTNVPAQSLTMMNDERMIEHATAWASRTLADDSLSNGRPAAATDVP